MKTNYEKLMKINYEKLLIFYLPFTKALKIFFIVINFLINKVIIVLRKSQLT